MSSMKISSTRPAVCAAVQCSSSLWRMRQPKWCRAAFTAQPCSSCSTKSTWPGGRTAMQRCRTWFAWGDFTASHTWPRSACISASFCGALAMSSAACTMWQPCRMSDIDHVCWRTCSNMRSRSVGSVPFSMASATSVSFAFHFGAPPWACDIIGCAIAGSWHIDESDPGDEGSRVVGVFAGGECALCTRECAPLFGMCGMMIRPSAGVVNMS
mmetsp:Transcript_56445/g.159152  ORF Transcript_56445/g.159152 Transcript_56445/m.159152 type:complete len:212 (+) Transcript_56445:523-1158(+)